MDPISSLCKMSSAIDFGGDLALNQHMDFPSQATWTDNSRLLHEDGVEHDWQMLQ